jgi:hypothetical protein
MLVGFDPAPRVTGAPTHIRIASFLKGSASFNLVPFVYWRASELPHR